MSSRNICLVLKHCMKHKRLLVDTVLQPGHYQDSMVFSNTIIKINLKGLTILILNMSHHVPVSKYQKAITSRDKTNSLISWMKDTELKLAKWQKYISNHFLIKFLYFQTLSWSHNRNKWPSFHIWWLFLIHIGMACIHREFRGVLWSRWHLKTGHWAN